MDNIQLTKDQLNQFVLANHGSFQQSWQWGELQEKMGRSVRRFLFDGAAATFVRHDLPMGKFYWLAPRGPVGEIGVIREIGEKLGGIFIRVEPETASGLRSTDYDLLVKAPKDHNPRATVIVDLTKSEEELLAGMHPKTRYNLRLAKKKELGIRNQELGFGEVWGLMQKTAKRDKFYLHPKEYYEKLAQMEEIKIFGIYKPPLNLPLSPTESGQGEKKRNILIAAAMVSFWGETATYLHGASDYEQRAFMAPYLLHWEIIRHAKAASLKYYDFGGAAPRSEPNHFLAGVTRFKIGWGGEYVEYAGSWDYVLDKRWYWIYKLARRVM